MPRVFISHSSLDHERVEREIISPLRAHGVETWYSTDSIKSASEWERQIRAGLKESDWFLIVLTPRSVASEWVGREVHWAFLKRKERIIPVMLETCEPDDLHLGLVPLQFIDFRNEIAAAQDRLLAIWGLNKATQIETLYRAAQEALAQDDWKAATQHLESVLRLDPALSQAKAELNHARQHQKLTALYDAGLTHLREKRWHEALATLREVQRIDGNYKDVTDSIALANAELQKEEAERLYREALSVADREEWPAAVEQLEAVLKLNPSHAEAQRALSRAGQQRELVALYTTGREHLRAERWREALKSFRRVRAIDKSFRSVADLIAEADAGLEEEEVHRSERERQETEAKEEVGRQAREQQELQARKQLYREAIDAIGREDWDAARERLQAVTAAEPGNDEAAARLVEVDRQEQLATLFDGGLQHLNNGRWAEALSAFRQVQEAGGDYKDVSAQIEQAETELKSLQERQERVAAERREKQERERREAEERARLEAENLTLAEIDLLKNAEATQRQPEGEQTPDVRSQEGIRSDSSAASLPSPSQSEQSDRHAMFASVTPRHEESYKRKILIITAACIALLGSVGVIWMATQSMWGQTENPTPVSNQQTVRTMNATEAMPTSEPTPEPIPTPDRVAFQRKLNAYIKTRIPLDNSLGRTALEGPPKVVFGDLNDDRAEDAASSYCVPAGRGYACELAVFINDLKGNMTHVYTFDGLEDEHLEAGWGLEGVQSINAGKIICSALGGPDGDTKMLKQFVLVGNRLKVVR